MNQGAVDRMVLIRCRVLSRLPAMVLSVLIASAVTSCSDETATIVEPTAADELSPRLPGQVTLFSQTTCVRNPVWPPYGIGSSAVP